MALEAVAFLALYASGLIASVVRHPIWGLYAYLFAFYVHPPSRWWASSVPEVRWVLIAAVVACVSIWIRPKLMASERPAWLRHPIALALICYAAWMWVQMFWALDRTTHLEGAVLFSKYVVLYYLIYKLAQDTETIRNILLVHVAGCFYLGWIAMGVDTAGRLDGVGGPGLDNANTLGMHLGTGIVVAACFILLGRGWWQWLCLAAVPILVNGVILTGSRGAFVAVIAGGMAIWYLRPRVRTALFYVLATLAGGGFLWLAQDVYWERMSTIDKAIIAPTEVDTSTESRMALFHAQWRMALDYPFGAGFRGTATLSPRYLDARHLTSETGDIEVDGARASHNTMMSVLVEQGFIGIVIYAWLLVSLVRELLSLRRLYPLGLPLEFAMNTAAVGAVIAVVLVAGIFTDYLKAEVQFWCFPLLASLTALAAVWNKERAPLPAPALAPESRRPYAKPRAPRTRPAA